MRRTAVAVACAAALAACSSGSGTGDGPDRTASPGSAAITRYDVGGQPCGVVEAAGAIWVSDAGQARLLRVDPPSGDADPVADLDPTPCEITFAFGSLWVITQSGRLDRVDPDTGKVVARIRVGATSYQAVAARDAIWVSNRGDGTLSRVDPRRNRVVDTIPTPGVQPGGLVWAAESLWIGDDTTGHRHLLRMDVRTGELTKVRSGGSRPAYLTTTRGDVWVSNVDEGTVSHLDGHTGRIVATLHTGSSPVNLKAVGGAVWVPDDSEDTVAVIDAASDRVVATYDVAGGPAVVAPTTGGTWVTLFEAGAVARVRPQTTID